MLAVDIVAVGADCPDFVIVPGPDDIDGIVPGPDDKDLVLLITEMLINSE